MSRKKITNDKIGMINETDSFEFPKYTTQIMNLANQNGQGTRPTVVGQLSELFPEYLEGAVSPSINDWEDWYNKQKPTAIKMAADRVEAQIEKLKEALPLIDRTLIERWLSDLIIEKTFNGMYYQKAIIKTIATETKQSWRLSTPLEESLGIDGFVGDTPISIKPDTYDHMMRLNEQINVKIITYEKVKDGIWINY